jgi:hypothetical protein
MRRLKMMRGPRQRLKGPCTHTFGGDIGVNQLTKDEARWIAAHIAKLL